MPLTISSRPARNPESGSPKSLAPAA